MKFMINFTHIDGAWEKLTPSELENIQARHKEFLRVLEKEQNTRMTFFKPAAEAKTVRRREDWSLGVTEGALLSSGESVGATSSWRRTRWTTPSSSQSAVGTCSAPTRFARSWSDREATRAMPYDRIPDVIPVLKGEDLTLRELTEQDVSRGLHPTPRPSWI